MRKIDHLLPMAALFSYLCFSACDIARIAAPGDLPLDSDNSILTDTCGKARVEMVSFMPTVTNLNRPAVRVTVKNTGTEPATSIFINVFAIARSGAVIEDGIIGRFDEPPLAPGESFEDVAPFLDLSSFSFIDKVRIEVECFNN